MKFSMKGLFRRDVPTPVKTEAPKVDPKKEFEDIVSQLKTTGIPNIAIDAEKFKQQFFDLATKAGLTKEKARDQYYDALDEFEKGKKSLARISPEALAKPPES